MLHFCFTKNFPMLYCYKGCKNVIRDKKFFQRRFFCLFFRFCKFPPKVKEFVKLGAKKFHSSKYKIFFQSRFSCFSSSQSSIVLNIRIFLILELESSISGNVDWIFFIFSRLGLKMHQRSL